MLTSTERNRLERQINTGVRGYRVGDKHVTRAEWLQSLIAEGFTQLTSEPHKSGIGQVYTLLNPITNQLYQFRKNVEGDYLQALLAEQEEVTQ